LRKAVQQWCNAFESQILDLQQTMDKHNDFPLTSAPSATAARLASTPALTAVAAALRNSDTTVISPRDVAS
jgi:hypothetical protein